MIRAELSGHYHDDGRYAAAVVNVTNRCNLSRQHCFIFRDGNPNESPLSVHEELSDAAILETLVGLRDRHGIVSALWMGGEPLLRRELIRAGMRLFPRNTIVTNGTIPLVDFGPTALYVVSLDGPEDLNDAIPSAATAMTSTASAAAPGWCSTSPPSSAPVQTRHCRVSPLPPV